MPRLTYGSFEAILRAHFASKITKLDMARILLTSPAVDARGKDRDAQRKNYDIDSPMVTRVCSGERGLPPALRQYHREEVALDNVKLCFFVDIVPRIQDSAKAAVLQEVLTLVEQDETLPAETKTYFAQRAESEELCDFLAEVYMCAVDRRPEKKDSKADLKTEPATASIPDSEDVYQVIAKTLPLLASWSNGNLSYTWAQVSGGILGDTIVFNSLSDGVIGNEKQFVGIREDIGLHEGKNNIWHPDYIDAFANHVYLIRLYIHNNNPNGLHAIAKNVKASFQVPTGSGHQIRITGQFESSNAVPSKYSAKIVFRNDSIKFHLEYIPGTARLENNGIGKLPGLKISDDIISDGVLVSYDAMNGDVPGGFQYANYISIRVKAVADSGYKVEQWVRLAGSDEWETSIDNVRVGDNIEYCIGYTNISSHTEKDVIIKEILPNNVQYIAGSTTLFTSRNTFRDFGQDLLCTAGINIGDYGPGANALIKFSASVMDDGISVESHALISWAQCCTENITLQDYSTINLNQVEPTTVHEA